MSLAQTTIEQLRAEYSQNRLAFDMTCTVFLSGQHRAQLRQQIVTEVSGKIRPVNQCTVFEVAEILKATFEQLTLF